MQLKAQFQESRSFAGKLKLQLGPFDENGKSIMQPSPNVALMHTEDKGIEMMTRTSDFPRALTSKLFISKKGIILFGEFKTGLFHLGLSRV